MAPISILVTPTTGAGLSLDALLQPQAAWFGLVKVRPDWVGVSAKSTITPSSIRRLWAPRNRRRPSISSTCSPGPGAASALNSEL